MTYDPKIHHRRSIRLPGHDYSSPGAYYVTICTHNKEHSFGAVVDGQMKPNSYGKAALEEWFRGAELRKDITLDAFTVMPNHVHGIIVRTRRGSNSGRGCAGTAPTREQFGKPLRGSLATLVRSYKSAVTSRVNQMRGSPGGHVWQDGFYEHVVRNEAELNRIRGYILTNPLRWASDRYNPERVAASTDDDEFDW